jgi:large repetitive protein
MGLVAAIALIAPTAASAASDPNISLEMQAPKTALLGTKQSVTLVAKNPVGEERGYNLSFRDVLPKGVKYVAGSAKGPNGEALEVRALANAPAVEETTLLIENVSDLSAASEYRLTFEVEPEPAAFTVNNFYEDHADAYVSKKARFKPKFNANGEVIAGEESFEGSAETKAKTTLTAIEIEKTEPSPEGEILRGVHEHQVVYTLHLRNNHLKATNNLSVGDYLPAGLEFLGCGQVDHTKDSPTTGTAEEYAGSGPIFPGNHPEAPNCVEPSKVETVELDPDGAEGPLKFGVYTYVEWAGLGELDPSGEKEIQYRAAVPIRENTMTWTGATPTPGSLDQAANLDNNSGKETFDEEPLVNYSVAKGKFNGVTEVEAEGSLTRTAEDLAIQKSVDKETIAEGQLSEWTFHIETSEYRYVNNIQVEDTLPNGLCPVGAANYEMPFELKEECEPDGNLPSAEYASVQEQEDGTWKILWDGASVPQLKHMAPSTEFTITFPTKTRTFYQENFKDDEAKPVLTGDSWTNNVNTVGENFARCAPNDPSCTEGEPKIFTEEAEGSPVEDVSSASQVAGGVNIDKTVRENTGGTVPADCEGTYVEGTGPTFPRYAPGDKICWQLQVNFASALYAGSPAVTDFLPPTEKYLGGTAQEVKPPSNVESVFDESEAEGGALEWTLGSSVASGAKVWEWRFATEMGTSLESRPEDITGNLMKFVYSDTLGQTFPLRDRAEIEREEPELQLTKGVYSVGGLPAGGNGPNQNATGAHGGEKVKYRLDLKNVGNLVAENIELWDRLPAGIECSDLVAGSISNGGTCQVGNIIVWTGLEVAAEAEIPSVTYELTLPTDVAPNQTYVNEAGVRQFQSPTNTGTPFTYYPAENIDPTFEAEHTPNTGKIKDPATVSTEEVGLVKGRTTSLEQGGNNKESQATIGETVNYKIEASVPAGSELFGTPKLTDPLGTRLALVTNTVKGSVKVGGVTTNFTPTSPAAGFSVAEEGGNPVLNFPTTFANPPGEGAATVTLEFAATVTDVAANNRETGSSLPNTATLNYQDQNATPKTKTASVTTTVVEPKVQVKKSHAGGETVKPGEVRAWTVTAENPNGTRVSTANESTVVDTVPAGLTPWKGGVAVANGGVVGSAEEDGTWSESARTITWTIAELAPGATKALHYELRVNEPANAGSIFKNNAVIKTTSMPGNVAGERTASSASHAGYEAKAEDLATLNNAELEKTVSAPKGTTIGSPLTYTLNLKLPPNITFWDTTVEDQLPQGIKYDGTSSITCAPGCAEVEAAGHALTPKVTGGAQLLGWYFGKVEPSTVERTVTITYTAHIAQELEGGKKVADKEVLQNKAIGLYSGEAKLAGPPTEPPPQGEFTNKTNEPNAKVEVKEPKLAIAKAVAGAATATKTQPGDEYTYTLTVSNTGDAPAYDVAVKDDNPQGALREVEPKGIEGEADLVPGWAKGDPLEWQIAGPIEPGASVTLKYKAKLAPSSELHQGDKIENVADVPVYFGASKAQREEEPTTLKEEEEGTTRFREYKEDPKDTVTLQTELPQLEVEKTVGPESKEEVEAEIGKPLTWHVKLTNSSPVAGLFGVDVVDTLPKGFEYKPGTTTGLTTADPTITEVGEEEVLTWEGVTNLAALESKTLNFETVPTLLLALEPGTYVNKVVATGKDASGATASAEGPYEAEDTAKAKLKTPGLSITKKPDVPEAAADAVAGEPNAYTLEITNTGAAEATGVEVSDRMGAGNNYTAGSATAEPEAGFTETGVEPVGTGETLVKWSIASIPAGGTVIVHIPVALSPSIPDGTTLVDHASVKSAQETTPKEDEGSLLVKRQANLTLEKKGPATAVAGELVEYEVIANNPGPSDAEDVTLHDRIPAGLKFVSADLPCEPAPGGTEVICELGTMPAGGPGQSFHVAFEVLPDQTGPITNKATLTSPTKDPRGEEEPRTVEPEVTTTVETDADVTIDKTGPSKPVLLGSTFVYTLEVENEGPSDAQEVDVEDPLPAEVEALSVETDTGSCEPAAATIECELGTLIPGEKATIHVTVKAIGIPAGGGNVVNTATVTSPTDPLTPKESSAETTVEPAADLAVAKTAPATVPADGEITYGLHVENDGPSDATGVKLTDPLPAGTQFVSASEGCAEASGTVTCEIGELKFEEERDYKVTVKVPLALAGQPLVNTATVTGEQADPESKNDQSTVTTTVGPAADLSITKTMGRAEAGKPLVYTLAITNHGPSASSAVTVKDTLPAGTTFKSAAPSQGTCSVNGQAVTCELGALASGGSAQVSITVEVSASATGTLRNVASVEGPEPDPDKSNNESAVEGPINPAPAVTGTPNLKVVKTADTSTPQVGVPFDYDVSVSNSGEGEAKNVKVVDTLNGPVKVLSFTPGPYKCAAAGSKIECTIPSVPVGKTVHVTYSVVAESAGPLSNTASAEAANGEKAPANNHAVKGVRAIAAKANFTLAKKASRPVVEGGQKVGFTITLHNGATALTNAKVCDRLPAALVFVKAAGAGFVNGEACWREHYVAPHKLLSLHLIARAVKGSVTRRAKNVASASAANAKGTRKASATVRIKPVFGGAPGGVTG